MGIIDLLDQDGHHLRRKSSTRGGEFAGPCPFCKGGVDRFLVWPNVEKGGRYWCRHCERSGDAVQYLRDARGLSFADACRIAGMELPDLRRSKGEAAPWAVRNVWSPRISTPPLSEWQQAAEKFLQRSIAMLWSARGEQCRRWLQRERGLTEETIRTARMGVNADDFYRPRTAWGLPIELNPDTGRPKTLWIPTGLIIPCLENEKPVRLRVRRFSPGEGGRYIIIPGSDPRPMAWGLEKEHFCIVESELDGILLNQVGGDMAGVIALGSAQAKPDDLVDKVLNQAATILVCLDGDPAGATASWRFWSMQYPFSFKRWPVPIGKDPGEAYKAGLDLRTWLRVGIGERKLR